MSWLLKAPLLLALMLCQLEAKPSGFHSKHATVKDEGKHLSIHSQDKAIVHWDEFSIGADESVFFQQAGKNPAILNRVLGGQESQIFGKLGSNGRVFLLNPAGVLIGPSGRVETAGFIASSFDVLDADFLSADRLLFSGDSAAPIVNLGQIVCPEGDVALIARRIENSGSISAPQGQIFLESCLELSLSLDNGMRVFIRPSSVAEPEEGTAIEHTGMLEALSVELQSSGNLYSKAIRSSGKIDAMSVQEKNGSIYLVADTQCEVSGAMNAKASTIHVLGEEIQVLDGATFDVSGDMGGGTILIGGDYQGKNPEILNAKRTWVGSQTQINADALENGDGGKVIIWSDHFTTHLGKISAKGGPAGGDGGLAEVSGKGLDFQGRVDLRAQTLTGKTGTLLLDPSNITISGAATSGGSLSACSGGSSSYTAAGSGDVLNVTDLTNNLATCSVTVDTASGAGDAGTITVSSPISWTNGAGLPTTLTLNADGEINVGANITHTGGNGTSGSANNAIVMLGGRNPSSTFIGINLGSIVVSSTNGNIVLTGNGTQVGVRIVGGPCFIGYDVTFQNCSGGFEAIFMQLASSAVAAFHDVIIETDLSTPQSLAALRCAGGITTIPSITAGNEFHMNLNNLATTGTSISISGGTFANRVLAQTILVENVTSSGANWYENTNGTTTVWGSSTPITVDTPIGNITVTTSSITFQNCSANNPTGSTIVGSDGVTSFMPTFSSSGSVALGTTGKPIQNLGAGQAFDLVTGTITAGTGGVGIVAESAGTTALNFTNTSSVTTSGATSSQGTFSVTSAGGNIGVTSTASLTGINGDITLTGPLNLGAGVTFTSANGSFSLAGTSSTLTGGGFNATLNATNGNINFGGTVSNVGTLTADANSSGTVTFGAGMNTVTSFVYTGKLHFTGTFATTTTGAGLLNFTPAVIVDGTTVIDGGASALTNGATYDGNAALTIQTTNTLALNGALGSSTPLASVSLRGDAGITLSTNISAVGNITVTNASPVTLGTNVILTTTSGTITFPSTINGAHTLTVTGGSAVFNGVVGGSAPPTNLSVSSAATINADQTVAGPMTYLSTVTLGGNAILTTTGGGTITFSSTINGAHTLTVNGGPAIFNGIVGGSIPPTGLSVGAAATISANQTVAGPMTYSNAVTLGGNIILTTTGGGTITFSSTINGARTLTVNGGPAIFNGIVGGSIPPTGLSVGAAATISADQTVAGPMTYTGAVTLGGNSTLTTTSGGAMSFTSITGNFTLGLAAAGSLSVTGNIDLTGANSAGKALTATSGGAVTIAGSILTNGLGVAHNGGAVSITSTGGNVSVVQVSTFGSSAGATGGAIALTTPSTLNGGALGFIPVGILILNGDLDALGSATGGNINLGGGKTNMPSVASISSSFAGNNVSISGNQVIFSLFESISVLGNLTIHGTTSVTLQNVVALGTLTITTPTLTPELSGPFLFLNSAGTLYSAQTQFVSGGTATFSSGIPSIYIQVPTLTRSQLIFPPYVLEFFAPFATPSPTCPTCVSSSSTTPVPFSRSGLIYLNQVAASQMGYLLDGYSFLPIPLSLPTTFFQSWIYVNGQDIQLP